MAGYKRLCVDEWSQFSHWSLFFFFQESLRLKLVHFGNLTSIGCLNDIFLQVLFNIY